MQITAAEFAAALEPLLTGNNQHRLAVAVSGGPDSMALAFCLKRWATENDTDIIAFIVDHNLRPESSDEAAFVAHTLLKFDIPSLILHWEHDIVTSRVEAQARAARYDLLAKACHMNNISHLLLAHQKDEQAETILMRLAKGSGLDGLAGIAPITERDGLTLVRPMLGFAKQRLIATCDAAKLPYVTDPTNASTAFARGRLRQIEPLLAAEGLTVDRLCDLGERASEAKEALIYATKKLLAEAAVVDLAGVIHIDRILFRQAPIAIAARALSDGLHAVSPAPYPPERSSLMPIIKALRTEDEINGHTLQSCLIAANNKNISVFRELSAITQTTQIAKGQKVIWDKRWLVSLSAAYDGPALTLRALGLQPRPVLAEIAPLLHDKVPQGRARATLPALWIGNKLAMVPDLAPESTTCPAHAHTLTRLET